MSAEQMLLKYVSEHPDYWEFENEAKVVASLKELCRNENIQENITTIQKHSKLMHCA